MYVSNRIVDRRLFTTSSRNNEAQQPNNQEPRCLCTDAPSHCQQLKLRKFKALPMLFEEGVLLLKLCQQMTSIKYSISPRAHITMPLHSWPLPLFLWLWAHCDRHDSACRTLFFPSRCGYEEGRVTRATASRACASGVCSCMHLGATPFPQILCRHRLWARLTSAGDERGSWCTLNRRLLPSEKITRASPWRARLGQRCLWRRGLPGMTTSICIKKLSPAHRVCTRLGPRLMWSPTCHHTASPVEQARRCDWS